MNLATLRLLGFDRSRHVPFTKQYSARCSQCAALVINGTPTHETGCPHATQECRGCTAAMPASRFERYCEDCR